MDLIRNPELSITFGDLQILQEGDVIDAGDGVLDFDTQFTTEAVSVLNADAPVLDEHGNTARESVVSIATEYETIAAALADIIARQNDTDETKRGVLTYTAGTSTRSFNAGLLRLTQSTSRSANGVRVIHTYSFVIAGVVTDDD